MFRRLLEELRKKRGRPSLDVAALFDGSAAPHGCSSSTAQSAPQLAPELVGEACSPAACQKKCQEPQRKCKYPLMALIQMDALMTIGPRACGSGVLSLRNAEGRHNNAAKLCMQDKYH